MYLSAFILRSTAIENPVNSASELIFIEQLGMKVILDLITDKNERSLKGLQSFRTCFASPIFDFWILGIV